MSWIRRLFSWLWKKLFAPKALTQSNTRYHQAQGDLSKLDQVDEAIPLQGPLRPKGHRQIVRDPRLLPKPGRRNPWEKPPRVMSKEAARRRFSLTFRTRNRAVRDLLADEAQLVRLGLPLWQDEETVAAALDLTVGQLRHLAMHRNREQVTHYVCFRVPKRSGGHRIIMAPKRRLKAVQRTLLRVLVAKLRTHDAAHGFVTGRSTRTAATPHVGKAFVLRMDLADFFGSVTFARVRGFLIAMGYGFEVATVLALLMTEAERQPVQGKARYHVPVGARYCVQGAPTSPALCNALAHKLDARLAGLARSMGLSYTRYADDLSFSGDDPVVIGKLMGRVSHIVRAEGFTIRRDKTRVMRRGQRQEVVGVCVNETLGLSRKKRRQIRAMIHAYGKEHAAGKVDMARWRELQGWVNYVAMLNPAQAEPLRRALGLFAPPR